MLKLSYSKNKLNSSPRISFKLQKKLPTQKSTDQFSNEIISIKKLTELIAMYPEGPEFLGSNVMYPNATKWFQFFSKKMPDLSDIRSFVSNPNEISTKNIRLKIKKVAKKYRYNPEIRALNAIQVFNDTSMSGLTRNKLSIIKGALIEITNALYNNGTSIFNVTWFIKIYLKYLDLLSEKYTNDFINASGRYSVRVENLASKLHKRHLQVLSLLIVRERLGGLAQLNQKMKRTRFVREGISPAQIAEACKAILQGNENKIISEGKSAKHTFGVAIIMYLLFAKIPIMKDLVLKHMRYIPDVSRHMILQKAVIINMIYLTEFRLAFAANNKILAKRKATSLFNRCIRTVDQYLESSMLSKSYEVDPYMKSAWIVKASRGLFPTIEYRAMVAKAIELLNIITEKRGRVKGVYEQANILNEELNKIKLHYGWKD